VSEVDKRVLRKGPLLLLLTILFALALAKSIPPSNAIAEVYAYPKSITDVDPPDNFTVDVKISGANNVFAFEFKLGWNSSVLNFVKVTEGTFLKGIEQNPTYFVNKTFEDQSGTDYIGVVVTRMGYVKGVSGSGVLASVTFNVEVKGETVLDLFDVKTLDSTPQEIPSTSTDGFFTNMASAPRPIFTYTPTVPRIGETVIFNATASFDPDGTIVEYFWDFGDGLNATETDPITTHAFSVGGNHTVALTVTDDIGLTNTGTQSVKVRHDHNIMVTAVSASPDTVTAGDTVEITVTVVNDGVEAESFSVTAYYDSTATGDAQTVSNLAGLGQSKTLKFSWKTTDVAPDTYRIKAVASTVTGETETKDNEKLGGTVTVMEAQSFPWMLVGAGAAIAAIAVIGVFFFMRRKGS
jgi:hypothetical protein